MHAKRLFAADVRLALSVFARTVLSQLFRASFLAVLYLVAGAATAQGYIFQWTAPRIMHHWINNTVYYDSVQAAFNAAKPFYEGCDNQTPQTCVTLVNLRPSQPGLGDILFNGIPYWWTADRRSCTSGVCTNSGGPGFEGRVVCPENSSTPAYWSTQINSDQYDRRYACRASVPDVQPCTDCGRGNPILPGTGHKIQTDTDYASASGGLRFERTYRSNVGYWSSPATAGLLDNRLPNTPAQGCFPGSWVYAGNTYTYCHPYLTTGTQNYQVKLADGRFALFGGLPGAFTSKADINDKLSQQTNPSGAIEWVLLRQDDSTEIYNAQGQLIRKTSLGAREDISYAYSNGRLATVTDHFGRQLAFGYDAAGRLATMTDPGGGLYQYGYDTFGNLASVTYPGGTVRQYHYNEVGNVTCFGGNQNLVNALTGISENGQRFATFKYECGNASLPVVLENRIRRWARLPHSLTQRIHLIGRVADCTCRAHHPAAHIVGIGTSSIAAEHGVRLNGKW